MIDHTLRKKISNTMNMTMTWAPKRKRKIAQPKTTWVQTVQKRKKEGGWKSREEATLTAANREKLKNSVEASFATSHKEDRGR